MPDTAGMAGILEASQYKAKAAAGKQKEDFSNTKALERKK